MRTWTAHTRPAAPPVLVKEAFSWGALLFGPAWLAWHRAWVPAVLDAALLVAAASLLPPGPRGLALLVLALLAGLTGRDMVRWSLERRGYLLCHVVAARDGDAAWVRLMAARPDLVPAAADLPP